MTDPDLDDLDDLAAALGAENAPCSTSDDPEAPDDLDDIAASLGQSGAPDDGDDDDPFEGFRGEGGRFLQGNPGGPGRPPGSVNFVSAFKRKCEEAGLDARAIVFETAMAVVERIKRTGDPEAFRRLMDRLCGPVPTQPFAATQVNVGSQHNEVVTPQPGNGYGPALPAPKDLGVYLSRLQDIATSQGLVDLDVEVGTPETPELEDTEE